MNFKHAVLSVYADRALPTAVFAGADFDTDGYYAGTVRWAASEGIVTGTSDTEFSPNENITREQIAAIFQRFFETK